MKDDTISRQAAIARAVPLNLFGREVMIVSVSELENLPSAQPEPSQVARDIATIIENEKDMRVILKNASRIGRT